MGIGDWGLGDWGLPNPQSPIPNPQSPTKSELENPETLVDIIFINYALIIDSINLLLSKVN